MSANHRVRDLDQTCTTKANIVYLGECQQPPAGCADPPVETGGEETAGETGGETGSGLGGFEDLDLDREIHESRGEYLISDRLITAALADPAGLAYDGTTNRHNLGGHLGLEDGDVLIEVDGQPTLSYPQLLDVGVGLLEADTATVTIVRGGSLTSMRYRRD